MPFLHFADIDVDHLHRTEFILAVDDAGLDPLLDLVIELLAHTEDRKRRNSGTDTAYDRNDGKYCTYLLSDTAALLDLRDLNILFHKYLLHFFR